MAQSVKQQPRLEIEAHIDGKTQQIEIPQYSLRFPNHNRVSLAAVKQGIYHPDLSTIQKNVNENFLSKFPIENSKTSTSLANQMFAYTEEEKSKVAYPIKLIGDIDDSTKRFYKPNNAILTTEPASNIKEKSCVSGKEDLRVQMDKNLKEQFRFNRIRMVPSEHPDHGHRPCYFSTEPGVDKFGRKVESVHASQYRINENYKYTNLSIPDGFKPYGYTKRNFNANV